MVVASGDVGLQRFLRRDAGVEVDRLYRRHLDEVLRYAALVLRSRSDAEDVAQTVFLRALRAIERGEKVRAPRNWLIKITHNECRRLLATRKVHSELPDEISVEPAATGRADELRLAMAALPATQRQALVLRELEGRTYAEIAKALDLSESAVETLIFRARRALREQMESAITCEEFAELLEDPAARTRVRAHARVCPECATLDHQVRGRKSALKRIASSVGLPWWGAKIAAVALTTATAAAVAVPHDGTRPKVTSLNLIPPRRHLAPAPALAGGTRFKSLVPKHAHAPTPVAAAPTGVSDTAPVSVTPAVAAVTPPTIAAVLPGPEPTPAPAPAPPPPDTEPPGLPSPTKIVPVVLPAIVDPVPAVPFPAVAVPAVAMPEVTVTISVPKISLP
jgi:RNA polymerase sigma factor (sigma-70 family)